MVALLLIFTKKFQTQKLSNYNKPSCIYRICMNMKEDDASRYKYKRRE